MPDPRDPAGRDASPAKVLTTSQARGRISLTIVVMFAVLIGMVSISKATIMWIAALGVWVLIWIGFWALWGRYWHPIRQFRYEWGGYRRGAFSDSTQSEASFKEEWRKSGGDPPQP